VVFGVLASTVEGDLRRVPEAPDADLPRPPPPDGGPAVVPGFRARLTVQVTGARSDRGMILVWVYDQGPLTETTHVVARASIAAATHPVDVTLELPRGSYAVMAIHDENDDGTLELRPGGGPPAEGMGLSGSPAALQGPPDFERARFELEGDGKAIEVPLVYR
jgi:uncharacterized protein (DUF2141 family)